MRTLPVSSPLLFFRTPHFPLWVLAALFLLAPGCQPANPVVEALTLDPANYVDIDARATVIHLSLNHN